MILVVCSPAIFGVQKVLDYLMVTLTGAAEAKDHFLQVERVSTHCSLFGAFGLNLKAPPEGEESALCQGFSALASGYLRRGLRVSGTGWLTVTLLSPATQRNLCSGWLL